MRITATVAALVLLALTAAGVIIYALETARVDQAAREQADQEIEEFRTLVADGRDPTTAEPFTSAQDLLDVFLNRNVPSDDELLVGWLDGRARYVSTGRHAALAQDPGFAAAVGEFLDSGTSGRIETTYGDVLVAVQPVNETTGGQSGLVVATFLDDARAELHSLMRTFTTVSLLSLVAITAIAAWQAGRLLSPIRRLNETARAITGTDLSARLLVTGNDDISALTSTFNEMLARLEAAFAVQRQFLDDAGHELRTPLTVLRGHLELLDEDDPVERAETQELLLDEVDRMSRLVGDLILLAKSRRPDFLVLGEVDVESLTQTVLAKARGLGERNWILDGVATGTAVLDEQRITQALLQLADNAVKHTDPGAEIAIGSARTDGVVRLWVRDTGEGIDPADRETVLQRFGRSRVRPGDGGFGLGLSIVHAILDAHGGAVEIHDAEPHGARVELTVATTSISTSISTSKETPWLRS